VKIGVILSEGDVSFLDEYAGSHGLPTRSSVLLRAVRLLRESELGCDYAEAWDEWAEAGEGDAWDAARDTAS
jgi:hypothetical protein